MSDLITKEEYRKLDMYEMRLLAFYRLVTEEGTKYATIRETVRGTGISTNKVLSTRSALAEKGYIEPFMHVRGAEIKLK